MAIDRITWRDAQQMPDDGKRYEAIEGDLYVIPAPKRLHQWVSHLLAVALHRLLVEPGYGEVYEAPFGVEFPTTGEGAQPDLQFVSRERLDIIGDDGVRGAPDLVVEILSPTTAARDRGVKLKPYRRHGVARYWIIDPDAEWVEVWGFPGGADRPTRYTDRLPVHVGERAREHARRLRVAGGGLPATRCHALLADLHARARRVAFGPEVLRSARQVGARRPLGTAPSTHTTACHRRRNLREESARSPAR